MGRGRSVGSNEVSGETRRTAVAGACVVAELRCVVLKQLSREKGSDEDDENDEEPRVCVWEGLRPQFFPPCARTGLSAERCGLIRARPLAPGRTARWPLAAV
jgi:hypothetical protein